MLALKLMLSGMQDSISLRILPAHDKDVAIVVRHV